MADETINLDAAKIDQQLFYRIPHKFLEENRLIPIDEPETGVVEIAIADPDNIEVLDEVERNLNARLVVKQAPAEQILRAIERCRSGETQSVEKVIEELTPDDFEIIGNIRKDQEGVDVANEAPIIKLV
ncbi:hypothetical protein GX586_03965, partial [bacterium]|nr:hypothetical protein [bacterium]